MRTNFDRSAIVRLPRGIAPIDGEHAGSFVQRLAITNGMTASQLSAIWGTSAEGMRIARAGHQATPELLSRLRILTGGAVPDLERLWAYPPAAFLIAAPRWRPLHTSRYCSHCLAENGAWLHAWRSRLNVVCPKHACLLRGRCPTCDAATLGHGRLNYPGEQAPVVCAACEFSLIACEPSAGSTDWPALTAIHRRNHQCWREEDRDRVEGDLWTLVGAALRIAPGLPADAPERVVACWDAWRASPDSDRCTRPTTPSPVAAAALVLADRALHDGHALRRLYRDHAASLWQLRAGANSQQLAATAAIALNHRPGASRQRMLADTPCDFVAEQIPQRLPAELYLRFFADITPRDERVTRRVVPIILASIATGRDWTQAATDLELSPLADGATVSNWYDAARATDSLDVTLDRLRAIAEHYSTTTAVDYAARRRMGRRLARLDDRWWRHACERAGQRTGRNGVKNRCAAVFVWQAATCGDPWRAPWLSETDAPVRRNAYRQFTATNLSALRPHLEVLAGQLADLSV